MRSKIVLKLFTLTTLLCMFILTTVFIGQTIFFKQYYARQKINDIQSAMDRYADEYLNNNDNKYTVQKLEQDFYQEQGTWITTLDENGNLTNVDDFYIEVHTEESNDLSIIDKKIRIPLYYLIDFEETLTDNFPLTIGEPIAIYAVRGETALVPISVGQLGIYISEYPGSLFALDQHKLENEQVMESHWENKELKNAIRKYLKENRPGLEEEDFSSPNETYFQEPSVLMEESEVLDEKQTPSTDSEQVIVHLIGTVTAIHLPTQSEGSNAIYTNPLFMNKIREFQASLLFESSSTMHQATQIRDEEQNNIQYKILTKRLKVDDHPSHLFAMTSLQPVDEAVQMVKEYYVYLIAIVMLLVLIASFYYSKKIANPLLKINYTTKKMANLDFSERVSVKSKDELGTLSENINILSDTLHTHINQLHEDIQKEKQLENTRKEFISGVSHELKTPLSIMKSTISILQDDVAKDKKGYYFQALEKEVDKMDRLIADMLELAKYESGTYQMKMEPFHIDETIEKLCALLELEAAKKQVKIKLSLQPFKVLANEHRIEQVITNFLTNAIRHTRKEGDVFVSLKDEENEVKICVENTGEPIPVERIGKIWERFYRGDTSRERSKGETGLGLAISRNILELHESKYGVVNTEKGVLFYFYLKKNQ
ncbi:sensor histidine kinase [Bacillus niameyensis]|uniref:sensor histidine kinase n=1 Tax=Bacillus niameyensis TaxID=1522308 RepID=UPI0007824B7B|nr:HAMP domain-containing sensor histidine kinase [Bacillus niameyensis]